MNHYGPEAQAILEAARHADDPSELQLRRAGHALALRVGAGTAVLLTAATASGAFWSKVTIALLLVGATGGGSSLWWRATHSPKAPATAIAAVAVTAGTPPELAPVLPAIAPLASKRARHTTSRRLASSSPSVPPSRLEEETDFIANANRKLDAGQKSEALVLLDEYDRLFPKGLLREESAATRTIAHCQISAGPEAAAGARRFMDQHPRSPLLPRVERACLGATR
jgi:hypothetical protein